MAAKHSPQAAIRWRSSLLEAVESLEIMPARCHLAPESKTWKREIRELLHGKRRGIYRILFEIRGDTVYVVKIRHGARRLLTDE